MNQQVASELLTMEGATVDLASNGDDGIAMAVVQPCPYDALIMDVQMPGMDGYEATRRLRQRPHLVQLPIIAMTANASAEDRMRCLAAGMNEHIGKPFDLDELVEKLRQACAAVPSLEAPLAPRIGTDAALARLGGNKAIYRKVLDQFGDECRAAVEQLRRAMAAAEGPAAAAAVHSIKGLASTAGAIALAELAASYEHAVRAHAQLPPADACDKLATLIDTSQRALDDCVPHKTVEHAVSALDVSRETLEQLLGLLDNSDMRAIDAACSLPMQQPSFAHVRALIDRLAFAEAASALRRHLGQL